MALRRTPLYESHVALGARMTPFAGWEMPVQYTGLIEEHQAVRTQAGLFDLSHMGEFEIRGSQAVAFLNHALTNDAAALAVGQAQYTLLPYTDGGVADDAILYRLPDHYLLVVNASNREKDLDLLRHELPGYPGAELLDVSDETALVALQGPRSVDILAPLADVDLTALESYHAAEGAVGGIRALIARTGYTGEDGFEIFHDAADAPGLWRRLLDAGAEHGLLPVGLGARDTLRLEAKMALYGHELSENVNPFEAGLGWAVKLDKGDFLSREALEREKKLGPARKLIGLEMLDRAVPRAEQGVFVGDEQVGFITSGTFSPTLKKPIALAYVPVRYSRVGTELDVNIRGRMARARVVRTPFYKRGGEQLESPGPTVHAGA